MDASFLQVCVEEFISHVHENLEKKQHGIESTPALNEEEWQDLTKTLMKNLGDKIRHQTIKAREWGGELGEKEYESLKYALVTYADEVFLRDAWPGRSY